MSAADVSLRHGEARARIALRGAEARDWSVAGRPLLWPGDAAVWDGISPILFPVVGWTRDGARVGGRHYALGLHGFAYREAFAIEHADAASARLTLTDSTATRAVYPFAFRLTVEYRLGDEALAMAVEVENPGDVPAPYAAGLHPGFRWPFGGGSREGAIVRFEKPERAEAPVIAPGGLVSTRMRPVPLKGRDLALSDRLFPGEALCFLGLQSRSLSFVEANGASITMVFPGFAHAALWTRPSAPFLCLEAWTGYSDPEGFAGDLFAKPSMRVLEPGERVRHEARFVFKPA